MAETIREKILVAIGKKLARVRSNRGFATDCGGNVQRETLQIDNPANLPAYVYKAGDETSELGNKFETCRMIVGIEGHVLFGNLNPGVVREQILGDTKRIMTDPLTLDDTTAGLAESIIYKGSTNESARAAHNSVGIQVIFEVKYRHKTGDPFSSTKQQ